MSKQRNKNVKNINTSFNPDCPNGTNICPHLLKVDDEPTQYAGLGFRAVLAVMGWIVFGFSNGGQDLKNSLFLYATPLLLDYMRFRPTTTYRKVLRNIGIVTTGFIVCIVILSFIGGLQCPKIQTDVVLQISDDFIILKNVYIKFKYIWFIMGIIPCTTIMDYFAYTTPYEKILVDKHCLT